MGKARFLVLIGAFLGAMHGVLVAQAMPREDVIDVPAIGEGLCFHQVFQSQMVLQRDKPIGLWGWGEPGERVKLTMLGKDQEATVGEDRKWKVEFAALPAIVEPFSITLTGGKDTLILENVLVGDVWVLGGQSNMEFPLSKVENGNLEIISANFPQIRILTVPVKAQPQKVESFARLHEWSDWSGRHFRKGDWDVCSPAVVRELSAIGYVFARRVHLASQVPIGVIDVSRGGTTVETWTPESVLRSMSSEPVKRWLQEWDEKVAAWDGQKDLEERIKRHHQWVERMTKEGKPIPEDRMVPTEQRPGPLYDANRPGNSFAGMIGPLEGLAVKGAIFHQGYNNCFRGTEGALMYRDIFPKMITSWRQAFGDPEMPFGILSLCTDGTKQSLENYSEMMANPGPWIREAQYQTYLEFLKSGDEKIGFVSTYDLRRRWYHPQLKVPAGERIARWALATQYGFEKELRWKPPMILEMSREDIDEKNALVVRFDQAVGNVDDGGGIEGFAIAGADRKFHPAQATHLEVGKDDRGRPRKDQKALVLSSPMVPEPLHYRYAWGRNPMGNVQAHHNTDLALATQRSDDWPLEELYLPDASQEGREVLQTIDARRVRGELRKFDEQRHRRAAEALLEKVR